MSRIDDLIAEHCPSGVAFHAVGSVCEVLSMPGKVKRDDYARGSEFPIVDQSLDFIAGYTDDSSLLVSPGEYVVFGDHTRAVKFIDFAFAQGADGVKVLQPVEALSAKWLYHCLSNLGVPSRGYNRHWTVLRELRIPIPPLPVQDALVTILDKMSALKAELEAELETEREYRSRQYTFYRDDLLTFSDRDIPWSTLGEVAVNLDSRRRPVTKGARERGPYPYYGASGVVDFVSSYIFDGDYLLVSEDGANLLARSNPIAFTASGKTWINNHAHVLQFEDYPSRRFIEIYLNSIDLGPYISGAAQPKLNKANLNRIPVPVPPSDEQRRIVAILDKLDALVKDLSVGLPAEVEARRRQYEYYRDKLLTFEEAA